MTKDNARRLVFEPGEVIIISSGRYSDYTHYGVYSVEKLLTADVIAAIAPTIIEDECYLDLRQLKDALLNEGYIKRISYRELYLGAYSDLDLEIRS